MGGLSCSLLALGGLSSRLDVIFERGGPFIWDNIVLAIGLERPPLSRKSGRKIAGKWGVLAYFDGGWGELPPYRADRLKANCRPKSAPMIICAPGLPVHIPTACCTIPHPSILYLVGTLSDPDGEAEPWRYG
jgi:hypothetical protein